MSNSKCCGAQRAHQHVGHHLLAVVLQRRPLQAGHQRVHLAPLGVVELDELVELVGLGRGDPLDRHVADRQERAAVAAEAVVDLAAGDHHAAAVGQGAELRRQQAGGNELLDRLARPPLAGRGQLGQLDQLDVGRGLQPPGHLHAVLRRDQVVEEGVGEIDPDRVLAAEGHDRAGVAELARRPQRPLARRRGQEPGDQPLRRGHEMIVAVDDVVRADRAVGRAQIGHVPAADLDLLLLHAAGGQPLGALLGEAGPQRQVVAGLEEEPVGGPFAEEHVRAHQGHVGDHRVAQHPRENRLLQHQLPLDAAVQAVVQPRRAIRFCASPPHLASVSWSQRKLAKLPKRT